MILEEAAKYLYLTLQNAIVNKGRKIPVRYWISCISRIWAKPHPINAKAFALIQLSPFDLVESLFVGGGMVKGKESFTASDQGVRP